MIERRRIVEQWRRGEAVALVTLVRVAGSSYRKTGARILLDAKGVYAGSVSGGCLEAEVVRKAPWRVRSGPAMQRYSTLFDDTAEIPYGLGCGGEVDLLMEPVDSREARALLDAMEASLAGERFVVRTVLPEDGLRFEREIRDQKGNLRFGTDALTAGAGEVFEEELKPPQRLFLFGAGDDAQPMAGMALSLGWSVFVIDGRPQWAKPERFPGVDGVFATRTLGSEVPRPTAEDAVVLMTHSYEQDRSFLEQVLPLEPVYLGLLGSKHRSALLVSEAALALGWSVDRACERVFAPIGLDLGGDGAEAIALSAMAEIQACVQGKLPHSRRLTPEVVAVQIERGGASRYLQSQCAL